MNAPVQSRAADTWIAQIAQASSIVLAAFCGAMLALPRAGRAAAGALMQSDSRILSWVERTGAGAEGILMDGVLASAFVAIVATAVSRSRTIRPAVRVAKAGILLAGIWVCVRRPDSGTGQLWWPAIAGTALAGAALAGARPRALATGAVLQAGIVCFGAWALMASSSGASCPPLEHASEILVLGGVAIAGAASGGRARGRVIPAGATFALVCALSWYRPQASHAVVRHLVNAGTSVIPYGATAVLLAAALAGLILAARPLGPLIPLLVALVCARHAETAMVAGTLASSIMLVARGDREPAARAAPQSGSPASSGPSSSSSSSSGSNSNSGLPP